MKLRVLTAALAFVVGAPACSCRANPDTSATASCAWQVVSTRAASPGNRAFEDRDSLLREPANPNRVPGPRGMVAFVKTDSTRRPHIFLEDTVRHISRQLFTAIASEPRWSPDGTKLACVSWLSSSEPWVLTVVDLKTHAVLQPLRGVNVMGFKWSPDGARIAVTATLPRQPRSVLALVTLPNAILVHDTLSVLADYELAWSPDSRTLAFARPTAIDADEEVTASDLWLLEDGTTKCPLLFGPDFVETAPRWLDDQQLRYTRFRKLDPRRRTEDVVVTLASPRDRPR